MIAETRLHLLGTEKEVRRGKVPVKVPVKVPDESAREKVPVKATRTSRCRKKPPFRTIVKRHHNI